MTTALAAAAVIFGTVFMVASSSSGALSAPTMSISVTAGPVGTAVTLRGNAGTGCSASSFPTLTFEQSTTSGPVEFIVVPVAPDGAWSATFVIPPFVGGAATRGGYGADVTPGTWHFVSPTCGGTPITVPFQVTGAAPVNARFVGMASTPDGQGYWLAQADGGGYWLVSQDGGVYAFGDAGYYGSLPGIGITPFGVVVGLIPTPDGHGYWLLGADGGVFAFGDAAFYGAPTNGVAVTSLLATPNGKGYTALPANGDAPLNEGDAAVPAGRAAGPMTLDALISGGTITSNALGLWEVSTDGGVYTIGDAPFFGSLPGLGLTPVAPIVGMTRTPDGGGYWLVGADGGVFTFGDAHFYGSAA
jgi:hypothetical protein